MATFDRLRQLIANFFGVDADDISAESTANDIDGWDSIGHTMLIMEIENAFGITMEGQETQKIDNVGDLAALISQLKSTDDGVPQP